MKKYISPILALLTVMMLCACGAKQAVEAKPITDYTIDGYVEVHSCTYQVLNSGNTQYTLEFTASPGKQITVFNPPEGNVFTKIQETFTTGAKEALTFELTPEELAAINEVTISFCDDNGNCDFVYFWAPKEG